MSKPSIKTLLKPDESVIAASEKTPTTLVLLILFNRLCPGIVLLAGLGYAVISPASFMTEFSNTLTNSPTWLTVGVSIAFALGAGLIVYVVWEYQNSSIWLTDQRILVIKGRKFLQVHYSNVESVHSKKGWFTSEIEIKPKSRESIVMTSLQHGNASNLLNSIRESKQIL